MRWWRRLHDARWYVRWLVKGAAVGLTLLLVTFPYPHLLVRNMQRWRNPNALIEPAAPRLQPMVQELRDQLTPSLPPRRTLKHVEQYVCKKIEYAWDWDTWGVADYLPTVDEVLDAGHEDCDGRAVIAASLLRALGYQADLVSDFAHVWVRTDKGELMSPGKRKSIVASDRRGAQIRWKTLTNLPRAMAYGVSPFPLWRELIVLTVVWLALLRPGIGRAYGAVGALLLVEGLLKLRLGGHDWQHPILWLQLVGTLELVAAFVLLSAAGRRAARRSSSVPPVPEA